ncbi:DNA cytosine methyltransferase [Helicobacter pylori]|uniref:DNA cytosine methyltransferase n=1 Tax=Helicobacter pylori TaxID=210 RepID=UPI000EADE011
MLVSRFLNDNIDPFNLGVLLSRFQIKNGCIYGVCSYKSSKFVPDYEKSKARVLDALNTLSAHPIWQSNQESVTKIKGTFVFILENDLHLDENSFYKKLLNSLIDNDFFNRSNLMNLMTPNQKRFLSGFFESRGSIDTQRNFLTLDYFFHSPLEFKKFHYLIDHFNIPSEALNFNFRELQHEHTQATNHSQAALEKLKLINKEQGKECLPKNLHGKQQFKSTWGRLNWNKISPTIDTRFDTPSNGTNSHPELHRSITPREAARIQSFSDNYIFYGNKTSVCKQIGNAVPPLLALALGKAILKSLRK